MMLFWPERAPEGPLAETDLCSVAKGRAMACSSNPRALPDLPPLPPTPA